MLYSLNIKVQRFIAVLLLIFSLSFGITNNGFAQEETNYEVRLQEAHGSLDSLETGLHFVEESNELLLWNGNKVKKIPFWLSLLPPLLAIGLALVLREVHIALFAGIWAGAFIVCGGFFTSLFNIVDTYFIEAVTDSGHASIIIFSLLIGGMVSIISANGGMQGIVKVISKLATSNRRAQFATWLMGLVIFFDDYANTLVVGNTMRPLTDKFKISREKLAYLVDSTAAPIASIALVTTWIGFQLGQISTGLEAQSFVTVTESPYSIFMGSLKYSLYPILTILFILLIIFLKKDFGPMLRAEKISKNLKRVDVEKEKQQVKISHWINAALPVLTLIAMVIVGLFITGRTGEETGNIFHKIQAIVGNADSYAALLWASLLACIVAVIVSLISKTLTVTQSMESLIQGLKNMLPAVVILTLAWSLAAVIDVLHTSDFLIQLIPESMNARWLPLVVFILAALVAFSTGSSWGTMAILYPLCIPLTLSLATQGGTITEASVYLPVLFNVVSVVLAGSVFGDHCSPISDTTIMSSMASDCNHISHVRTQLPYALATGFVSIFCGCVLFAFGAPWYVGFIVGIALLFAIIKVFGKDS